MVEVYICFILVRIHEHWNFPPLKLGQETETSDCGSNASYGKIQKHLERLGGQRDC